MPVYLDCNATTPMDPRVRDTVLRFMTEEFGNAGSRTHDYGARAKQAVQRARDQVAAVVAAQREDVIFTSGATEANNLAVLGLAAWGEKSGRKHIVSTAIEHKAVLQPLDALRERGFEVTLVSPTEGGWVEPDAIKRAVRSDTLLVSVMQVNNETGVRQPLRELSEVLEDHPAYFHVDAAQGFGKDLEALRDPRLDLISVSAHKLFGPKGVGALMVRRRGYERVPLSPLMFGGGQERGLRPGTVPVHLVVGLGLAAELAVQEATVREARCRAFRDQVLVALKPLAPSPNGEPGRALPHVLNLSFPGLDSEAVMVAVKGLIAISNGAACTSQSYEPSHVLLAMGLSEERIRGALRLSWCHTTQEPDWDSIVARIRQLR